MSTQPTTKPAPPPATTRMEVRRERVFSHRSHRVSIIDIIGILHAESATGTLMIDFSQGGIGTIRFSDTRKIPL